jgi:hypothetical protein
MKPLDTRKTLELTISVSTDGFLSLNGSMMNGEGTTYCIGEYSGNVERVKRSIEYYIEEALAAGLMLTEDSEAV